MEDICKGCENNTGKECCQDPTGSYDPYNNCCVRVLELFVELKAEKQMKELYFKELKDISEVVDVGEHGKDLTHQGALFQRVVDMINRLSYKKETPQQEVDRLSDELAQNHEKLTNRQGMECADPSTYEFESFSKKK
jgi:hypothetical protein